MIGNHIECIFNLQLGLKKDSRYLRRLNSKGPSLSSDSVLLFEMDLYLGFLNTKYSKASLIGLDFDFSCKSIYLRHDASKNHIETVQNLRERKEILVINFKKRCMYFNSFSRKKKFEVMFERERMGAYPLNFSKCGKLMVCRLYNLNFGVYDVWNRMRCIKHIFFNFQSDHFILTSKYLFIGFWNQKLMRIEPLPRIISRGDAMGKKQGCLHLIKRNSPKQRKIW